MPYAVGTFASRAAVMSGNAIALAAQAARAKALKIAADALEVSADDLEIVDGRVRVKGAPDTGMSIGMTAVLSNPLRYAFETDPVTAEITILRYCVIHDCGMMINPMIVEGQVHGGVAQGVGGALYERMVYDESGQLLNASFMDFLMPYATEVPHVETDHLETPSPLNPLGIKGAGEAGCIPVTAVIASTLTIDAAELIKAHAAIGATPAASTR